MFKYRGKRLDNGQWVYGDKMKTGPYYHEGRQTLIAVDGGPYDYAGKFFFKVDPSTLGVCWGMKDKNKDVFTGDTLEDCCGYKGVVFFSVERNGFCLKVGDSLHPIIQGDYYKKLGNIHENKEIIEEE